jgi:DNA polymerase-4
VERLHRPELCGRAVVIGGRPGFRGVVAACSYEARALGIRSAMPMGEAYRRAGISTGSAGFNPRAVGRTAVSANAIADRAVRATEDIGGRGGSPHQDSGQGRPPSNTSPTGVVFLHDGLFGNYERYSRRVQDILRESVPEFHARSIDEFELDVSGCERLFARQYGGIVPFAGHLRARVRGEVGLKLSIGIGPSRIVAKMASRHAKPDGVFRVLPEEAEAFLGPHDIQAVPGIGPATSAVLRDMGVNRVEQLLAQPVSLLRQAFGIGMVSLVDALQHSRDLPRHEGGAFGKALPLGYVGGEDFGSTGDIEGPRAKGQGSREENKDEGLGTGGVSPPADRRRDAAATHSRPKSIGHETTFERDVIDPAVWERTLWRLTEDACRRLRAADLRTRQVTVKIRYSDFFTITHGGPLSEATDVDSVVYQRALELFHEGNTRRLRIRLLGVRLERLCAGASQGLLFETRRDRRAHEFFAAVDRIRERHGRDCVLVGLGVSRKGLGTKD